MKDIIIDIGIGLAICIIVGMVTYLYIQENIMNKLCEEEMEDGSLMLKDNILFCGNSTDTIPVKFVCRDFLKLDCTMEHLKYKLGV